MKAPLSGVTNPGSIAARAVTKRYGQVKALDDVSFDILAGESVALWGPNGAGKTTILRCLLGLARFDGTITVDGRDIRANGRDVRAAIGYVPQDLPVAPMTVEELAAFIARIKRVPLDASIAQLERLGIGDQMAKPVGALSGGMKQRLALALALIGAPRMLLLDEPTANLDARGRAELLDLLGSLKRERLTLIFTSHRPDDILALADRVLMIDAGVLHRSASPAEFKQELGTASHLVLTLTNGHLHEALETLTRLGYAPTGQGHVVSVPIAAREKAQVIGELVRHGIDIADFELERATWTDRSS